MMAGQKEQGTKKQATGREVNEMGVRRQCNRYRTEPSGKDFEEVLKKAKTFFRTQGRFEISLYGDVYSTTGETAHCFSVPDGTRTYVFNGKRWEETDRSDKRNSFFNR